MKLSLPAAKRWHSGWDEPKGHKGQDFGWGDGDQVMAAAPGTVLSVYGGGGYNGGWGNLVIIQHSPEAFTAYAHLATGTILVKPGQTVGRGQQIATMGNTGNSTAKHLHLELRLYGSGAQHRVDPEPYYSKDLPGTGQDPITPPGEEEDDDMARNSGIYWDAKSVGSNTIVYAVFNTESGFWHEFSNGTGGGSMPSAYNNALAGAMFTPSWAKVTESHANVIRQSCAQVRATK